MDPAYFLRHGAVLSCFSTCIGLNVLRVAGSKLCCRGMSRYLQNCTVGCSRWKFLFFFLLA